MIDSEQSLIASAGAMSKTLNKSATAYKTLARMLDRLKTPASLARPDYVAEAIDALKDCNIEALGFGDFKAETLAFLSQKLQVMRQNATSTLMANLTKNLTAKDQMTVLSDNPLTIYIHPLTLKVQLEQSTATLTYAHEVLQTLPLVAEEIVAQHRAILDTFRAMRIDSATFFTRCKMAYDMILLKENLAPSSRVDLVDLLLPLGWISQTHAAPSKKAPPLFPRYLFAYQLHRLRVDQCLHRDGWRLELGAATGGTTRNKANVLFVPHAQTEGQYYLSICFRQG